MKVLHSKADLRPLVESAKAAGKRVGFVPTMGALHRGHAALVEAAKKECEVVVVSVFVNPTQFGPAEDFSRYPRTLDADQKLSAEAGADIIYAPEAKELYPDDFRTWIQVDGVSEPLCGRHRPGHFRGVATVVHQLFQVVSPTHAYFGLKDLQQCLVVRQMVNNLYLPVHLRFCPTIRDADGLAMSSRNAFLSQEERLAALAVPRAIQAVERLFAAGERDVATLLRVGREELAREPRFQVQYFEVRSLPELGEIERVDDSAACAIAGFVGKTRLIDNCLLGASAL